MSIEGTNKTEKTISYIAYAIDFTVAGENSAYRIRLQDGNFYALPDALKTPGGLRVSKTQKHTMRFSDHAWTCHTTLLSKINERKARIVNVELFVEAVGFTDDTVWMFGSNLERIKGTSVFQNVDSSETSKGNNLQSAILAKARFTKTDDGTSGCCAPSMNYTSGSARPKTVIVSCSSCPPSAGGGNCPPPYPVKEVNSLEGQGSSGVNMVGFNHC